jgi:hypothetical protein
MLTKRTVQTSPVFVLATCLAVGVVGAHPLFAQEPGLVYETTLTEFTPSAPDDILIAGDGSAYVLANTQGEAYAVLVVKLAPDGSLAWSTIIDGESHDFPGAMTMDGDGNLYIVGTTGSDDLPMVNPFQAERATVQYDAFIMKLSGEDGSILYSTYLGGIRSDWGRDIAVNAAGEIFIVGGTKSVDFPTTPDAIQGELAGYPYWSWFDAFVCKFSADGSELLYSSFLGGFYDDEAHGLVLDADDRVHIVGTTESDDFPTQGPVQSSLAGDFDLFAARIAADGSALEYSTYLGGEDLDKFGYTALGGDGSLYITGATRSIHFPTTDGAYQEDFVGGIRACEVAFGQDENCEDVYVARLTPDGAALGYSTYLGGHTVDEARGLAVDEDGRAYVAGYTSSDDFPPYSSGTFGQIFLSRLDATGSNLAYTLLFDTVTPSPQKVAVEPAGFIYLAGAVHTPTDLYVAKLMDDTSMSTFAECVAGPEAAYESGCGPADLESDGDVDLADFAAYQKMYVRP